MKILPGVFRLYLQELFEKFQDFLEYPPLVCREFRQQFFGNSFNSFARIPPEGSRICLQELLGEFALGVPQKFIQIILTKFSSRSSGIIPGVLRELLQEFLANSTKGSSGIPSTVSREFFRKFVGISTRISQGIHPDVLCKYLREFLGSSFKSSPGIPPGAPQEFL